MRRVVIIGAGISGLALAFRLKQRLPNVHLTLLESESRPGGKIWTERIDGFLVEHGPNGFLETKPSTKELADDLGLSTDLVSASEASRRNRYLFLDGRLHRLPNGPIDLLFSRCLGWRAKWGIFRELTRSGRPPVHDESVADFFRRRMGQEAADILGDALVTGIHGGDPERLSLASAFPRAAEMEARYGSVIRGFIRSAAERRRQARAEGRAPTKTGRLWSFRHGLRQLIDGLVQALPEALVCEARVRSIRALESGWFVHGDGQQRWSADAVVLGCPADQAAAIVADLDAAMAEDLAGIAYNRIAVVALGYRRSQVPEVPAGFGYIAPQRTRRDVLGVQWCSSIYPDRAPEGFVLWRALCGGWNRGDVLDWDDDRLLRAVHDEIRLAMRVNADPVFHRIVRWPRAIPQYHLGHGERLNRIASRLRQHRGLYLTGNAYRGVALNDCTEQAILLAEQIARDLQTFPSNPHHSEDSPCTVS